MLQQHPYLRRRGSMLFAVASATAQWSVILQWLRLWVTDEMLFPSEGIHTIYRSNVCRLCSLWIIWHENEKDISYLTVHQQHACFILSFSIDCSLQVILLIVKDHGQNSLSVHITLNCCHSEPKLSSGSSTRSA